MSDVTVTLTQEESNIVRHYLDSVVTNQIKAANRLEEELDNNGSLTGKFGPIIADLDQKMIDLTDATIEFYSALAEKFPSL